MEMKVWKGKTRVMERHFDIKIWILKSPK